jgi:hypothetical protein
MTSRRESTCNATSAHAIKAEYEQRLSQLQTTVSASQSSASIALFALILCAALTVLSIAWRSHFTHSAVAALPLAGTTFALGAYLKSRAKSLQFARRSGFYEDGLARLRGDWQTTGLTGEQFGRDGHLYQSDLQILGKGSLFSLLCTTRSEAGAACLASYLLDPADFVEMTARQESVRELVRATVLREEVMLLGEYQFQECNSDTIEKWVSEPLLRVHALVRGALFACGSITCLLATACFLGLLSWTGAVPALAALITAQAAVSLTLFRRVQPHLKRLRVLTNEFSVLHSGLEMLQHQTFLSPKLQALVRRISDDRAPDHLHRLRHLLWGVAQREKELLYVPSLLLGAGTQLVLAVENWRRQHQQQLMQWIECWAEFETLNAIACYAYEHPADVFPEFVKEITVFEAENLGHPLLPAGICVGNDVALNEAGVAFYIVSGSNMAGKSTFLKAIGMNTVLARAGAPARATRMRLSPFTICASNSIADSLLDGKSKFMAEAERLGEALHCSSVRKPALFLIDEILSGTNSHDRRLACESIVRALIREGAVGVLSTHDLSLTEIAEIAGLQGMNCHMESEGPEDPLKFDFKVKAGISSQSNALAILAMIGIPPLIPKRCRDTR